MSLDNQYGTAKCTIHQMIRENSMFFLITIKKERKPGVSQPRKENERDKDKIPNILILK